MSYTLQAFAEDFLQKNREHLHKYYPGLTLRRIKQELGAVENGRAESDMFDSCYISHPGNPFTRFFKCLESGMPLEYISKRAWFYNSEFEVNSHVLIPRSETESLVEKSIEELEKQAKRTDEALRFCDVGTGSGVISISILQEVKSPTVGLALDISNEAIKVARRNYFNLRYTIPSFSKLDFIATDRLKGLEDRFHLIVSNPPYIKRVEDQNLVHEQVKLFEPGLALWLEDEDYDNWYRDFFHSSYKLLFDGGTFLMEGHENHLEGLSLLGEKAGFQGIELADDLTGRKRYLIMRK